MPRGDDYKHDKDKLRWDLMQFDVLDELARVYTFGAKEYVDNSWKEFVGKEPDRIWGALGRHVSKARQGEVISEDNLYHLSQVMWNAAALLWSQLQKEKEEASKYAEIGDCISVSNITARLRGKAEG